MRIFYSRNAASCPDPPQLRASAKPHGDSLGYLVVSSAFLLLTSTFSSYWLIRFKWLNGGNQRNCLCNCRWNPILQLPDRPDRITLLCTSMCKLRHDILLLLSLVLTALVRYSCHNGNSYGLGKSLIQQIQDGTVRVPRVHGLSWLIYDGCRLIH